MMNVHIMKPSWTHSKAENLREELKKILNRIKQNPELSSEERSKIEKLLHKVSTIKIDAVSINALEADAKEVKSILSKIEINVFKDKQRKMENEEKLLKDKADLEIVVNGIEAIIARIRATAEQEHLRAILEHLENAREKEGREALLVAIAKVNEEIRADVVTFSQDAISLFKNYNLKAVLPPEHAVRLPENLKYLFEACEQGREIGEKEQRVAADTIAIFGAAVETIKVQGVNNQAGLSDQRIANLEKDMEWLQEKFASLEKKLIHRDTLEMACDKLDAGKVFEAQENIQKEYHRKEEEDARLIIERAQKKKAEGSSADRVDDLSKKQSVQVSEQVEKKDEPEPEIFRLH